LNDDFHYSFAAKARSKKSLTKAKIRRPVCPPIRAFLINPCFHFNPLRLSGKISSISMLFSEATCPTDRKYSQFAAMLINMWL
jgi:hypothetical protein